MAILASYRFPLLAAAAILAPAAATAQEPEQRVFVVGAMQEPEQRVFVVGAMQEPEQRVTVVGAMQEPEQRVTVVGAMQEPEQRVTVVGAMQEPEQRVTVVGAAKDAAIAQAGEDPADSAVPELPIVYDEDGGAPAPAPESEVPAASPAGR